jgi:predicted nucleic acid-binding protein
MRARPAALSRSEYVRRRLAQDAAVPGSAVTVQDLARFAEVFGDLDDPELRAGFRLPPLASMPVEYLTPAIEDRAVEVLTLLADRGQHRAPSLPGLIIAAIAELAGLTVLHLDKDFEIIVGITGQPAERLNTG